MNPYQLEKFQSRIPDQESIDIIRGSPTPLSKLSNVTLKPPGIGTRSHKPIV